MLNRIGELRASTEKSGGISMGSWPHNTAAGLAIIEIIAESVTPLTAQSASAISSEDLGERSYRE